MISDNFFSKIYYVVLQSKANHIKTCLQKPASKLEKRFNCLLHHPAGLVFSCLVKLKYISLFSSCIYFNSMSTRNRNNKT